MTSHREACILTTIAYADVFDFPLTVSEIITWCVLLPLRRSDVETVLSGWMGNAGVFHDGVGVFFSDRPALPAMRVRRKSASARKWHAARDAALLFRRIPTVLLVGVTGGLSMNNADSEDDIDLFFIVRDGTLWVTRLLVTIVAEFSLARRRPGDKDVRDRVCLNMFLTRLGMEQPPEDRDLFGAHEVLQMRPLWQRRGTYRAFLEANRWVAQFLPNAWAAVRDGAADAEDSTVRPLSHISRFVCWVSRLLEPALRLAQQFYMRPRRTTETVTDIRIKFHPQDARIWVKRKLRKRLAVYNVPLDKVFYGRIK